MSEKDKLIFEILQELISTSTNYSDRLYRKLQKLYELMGVE